MWYKEYWLCVNRRIPPAECGCVYTCIFLQMCVCTCLCKVACVCVCVFVSLWAPISFISWMTVMDVNIWKLDVQKDTDTQTLTHTPIHTHTHSTKYTKTHTIAYRLYLHERRLYILPGTSLLANHRGCFGKQHYNKLPSLWLTLLTTTRPMLHLVIHHTTTLLSTFSILHHYNSMLQCHWEEMSFMVFNRSYHLQTAPNSSATWRPYGDNEASLK